MPAKPILIPALAAVILLPGFILEAQSAPPYPERAIRRDIPMTSTIQRAFAAGTRDSTGRPGRNYWQLRTDYTINVRLDTAASRLTGRESILIHNNGTTPLEEIVMRLDWNLFRPESFRASSWVPGEITDGVVITRMSIDGQPVDITGGSERNRARGLTSTVATITLAAPIAAGARSTLEVDWNAKVPGGTSRFHRMTQRWADTLYQPTQWYPRVAKYDDLRGWDRELYLGPSEFYNNFGRFDVSIDVPAGWVVSGTGVLQNPQQVLTPAARQRLAAALNSDSLITIVGADELGPGKSTAAGSRLVWRLVADSVNDFAWATSRSYMWRATHAMIPGKGPVPLNMYHLPGRANLFDNAADIARHALEFYSALWFPYEFPQFTMQDGPSAGMEYPMVINSNEGAADHETGHQWWPMTVSNNETWYAWMDEGFNQYMNVLSDAHYAGKSPTPDIDGAGQSYGRESGNEQEGSLMWNSNYGGPGYGFQAYDKTPLMLSMLGGVVGDSAVQRAMSEYAKAWRFKHPSPWDYMFFMNNALKKDLGWFWHYWLFTTESVDGSIQNVTPTGARTAVTVRQAGQMPSPVVLRVQFAATGPAIRQMQNSTVVDAVTSDVTFPVDVWFTGSRTFVANLDFGGRAIERITLDPGKRFPDRDPSDNVWPRASGRGNGSR